MERSQGFRFHRMRHNYGADTRVYARPNVSDDAEKPEGIERDDGG